VISQIFFFCYCCCVVIFKQDRLMDQFGLVYYDGQTDPEDFFKSFNMRAASRDYKDPNKLILLVNALTGKAKRVFDGLTEDNKKKFEEIQKALLDKCKVKSNNYEFAYQNKALLPNELISTYATGLLELIKKAHPSLSQEDAQEMVLNKVALTLPQLAGFISFGIN
jgi:hypothetical protein